MAFTPTRQYVQVGDEITAGLRLPSMIKQNLGVYLHQPDTSFGGSYGKQHFFHSNQHQVFATAQKPGQMDTEIRLFGFIPVKRMVVSVVATKTVVPGGQSIGVLLHSEGVLVVGEAPVETRTGKKNPARDVGIAVGDILIAANQVRLTGEQQLQRVVDKQGRQNKPVSLLVKHGNETKTVVVKPVLCRETGYYRIGLFIKAGTAGVGTLTFYDPATKSYGALGHMINNYTRDSQAGLHEGKIVEATVKGLQPGKKGEPGEKLGVFQGGSGIMGTIDKNTNCGIFGRLEREPGPNPCYPNPVPVALNYQVQQGPAEMLTVLEDNKIQKFTVHIDQVTPGNQNKGLVIRITDRALIRKTGGIIQGMSGSPIIQNGMLAGAVTHVYINDPTRGYGVLAENMLQEINFLNRASLPKNESNEKIAS